MSRLAFLLACAFLAVFCDDEINSLPGVEFDIDFKHYSGFLQVSDNHVLHYWFVEAQNDPKNAPLIFWFNGGPGCSSLDGLLNEMGPYVANLDGKTLRKNEYSWNKLASVVYIEAPAGVGYSYATDGNITTNDDLTSLENYEAVKLFFKKYPQFRHQPTFIMGESYGGVYVPTLTARIVDGQADFPINLKGMALGNGYVNEKLNIDTSVRYAYGHGLIDEKTWNTLERDCCQGCIDSCDLTKVEGHCATMVEDIFQFLWAGGLNPYDLYRDCDPNPDVNSNRLKHMLKGVAPMSVSYEKSFKNKTSDKLLKFLRKNAPLYGDAPCLNDTDVISYMNNPAVRKAINVPFNLGKWDICSDKVTTTYQKQYGDMAPFIKKIVNAHVRVLLYYGDVDMACNFMMGQQFVDQLGLRRTLRKTPWKFDRQIAGFKTLFDGLTFITVRGAGHMAPQWKAPQMYYAIQQFLLNHPI
ncbi:unnamed protein product [Caenorhabditis auriculariae]|uniref:Carboxypeptidase n=1 Tax=Caenorhabditis auriculariae TaxID=2777116 RepID=A0A8S1HU75_9PELO|nr:unnamed protein product [Caenorhabditis auriculariae]